ncbi:hypothetical protein PAPYR_383 [Paratrimastix pyriformis]|uniref:EamA domain-containing protein n=1 Tax=Paratrimastix pyriformis TaxID=342808 RepID=A0ABQ8UZD6_9EUKA|nr:hypothetical protein PAPYR_383 [Paratrimastix pyriformis]
MGCGKSKEKKPAPPPPPVSTEPPVEFSCPHINCKDCIRNCFPPDLPTCWTRFKELCVRLFPHFLLLVGQVALAGAKVYAQMSLSQLKNGFVFSALWAAVAIPPLFLISWLVEKKFPSLREMPWFALLGALGVSGHHMLLSWALTLTTALDAAIMQPFVPVIAALVAIIFRMEPFHWLTMIGALICTIAAVVMGDPSSFSFNPNTAYGMLLLFGSCLCDAFYVILAKPVLLRVPPLTTTAWSFLFGGSINILVGVFFMPSIDWNRVSASAWGGVLYSGLVSTSLVLCMQAWALARMQRVSIVASYTAIQPVAAAWQWQWQWQRWESGDGARCSAMLTAGLAALFLGATVTLVQGVGAFCICLGVLIVCIVRAHSEGQPAKASSKPAASPAASSALDALESGQSPSPRPKKHRHHHHHRSAQDPSPDEILAPLIAEPPVVAVPGAAAPPGVTQTRQIDPDRATPTDDRMSIVFPVQGILWLLPNPWTPIRTVIPRNWPPDEPSPPGLRNLSRNRWSMERFLVPQQAGTTPQPTDNPTKKALGSSSLPFRLPAIPGLGNDRAVPESLVSASGVAETSQNLVDIIKLALHSNTKEVYRGMKFHFETFHDGRVDRDEQTLSLLRESMDFLKVTLNRIAQPLESATPAMLTSVQTMVSQIELHEEARAAAAGQARASLAQQENTTVRRWDARTTTTQAMWILEEERITAAAACPSTPPLSLRRSMVDSSPARLPSPPSPRVLSQLYPMAPSPPSVPILVSAPVTAPLGAAPAQPTAVNAAPAPVPVPVLTPASEHLTGPPANTLGPSDTPSEAQPAFAIGDLSGLIGIPADQPQPPSGVTVAELAGPQVAGPPTADVVAAPALAPPVSVPGNPQATPPFVTASLASLMSLDQQPAPEQLPADGFAVGQLGTLVGASALAPGLAESAAPAEPPPPGDAAPQLTAAEPATPRAEATPTLFTTPPLNPVSTPPPETVQALRWLPPVSPRKPPPPPVSPSLGPSAAFPVPPARPPSSHKAAPPPPPRDRSTPTHLHSQQGPEMPRGSILRAIRPDAPRELLNTSADDAALILGAATAAGDTSMASSLGEEVAAATMAGSVLFPEGTLPPMGGQPRTPSPTPSTSSVVIVPAPGAEEIREAPSSSGSEPNLASLPPVAEAVPTSSASSTKEDSRPDVSMGVAESTMDPAL